MWSRNQGFTIIELLVAVGIVLALVALLVPSLQDANLNARSAVDSNQLKQINLGLELYKIDADDKARLAVVDAVVKWGVPKQMVVSSLDPTREGYTNCLLRNLERPVAPFKSSYISMADVTGIPTQNFSDTSEGGWLVAMLDKPTIVDQPNTCVINFEGNYLRLTFGGSVVRRRIQRYDHNGRQIFYYNSLFTDDRNLW